MQMRPLVEHADSLLKWSKRVFGNSIVNGIIRHTFFHQFCAGKGLPLILQTFSLAWLSCTYLVKRSSAQP